MVSWSLCAMPSKANAIWRQVREGHLSFTDSFIVFFFFLAFRSCVSVCLFTFLKVFFFFFKFDSEKVQLRGKILFNILKLYVIFKKCNFCAFGYYYRKLLKYLTSDYIGTYCPTILSIILIDTFLKEDQIGLMTGNWKRPQNLDAQFIS